jgi:hypothetical protein
MATGFIGVVIAVQTILMAILIFGGLFGGVGFDHPGSYGLDLTKMLRIGVFYAISLIFGATISVAGKRYKLLALQVSIPPLVFMAAIATAFVNTEPPTFNPHLPSKAVHFQYLIGKSKYEAMDELQHFGIGSSGFGGSSEWWGYEQYGSMEVHYSKEGKVVSIVDIK